MVNYKQAVRKRFRFNSTKGQLTVEDLWSLPLTSQRGTSLNSIAIELHGQLQTTEVSFVQPLDTKDSDLQLKFDIVKDIIETRMAENQAKNDAAKEAERKAKIRDIIALKKDQALTEMSVEDLEKML